jgi:hypothetical protein
MTNIVKLLLRTDIKHVSDDGNFDVTWTIARPDEVDLDALTPRARALAEAVAQLPRAHKAAGEIYCEHRTLTRGDLTPNPEIWLTPEARSEPAQQTWGAWGKYQADSEMPAAEYLERQARKIPPEWAITSGWVMGRGQLAPVASVRAGAADDLLTVRGVVDRLETYHDRNIQPGTWRSYVARDQAPAPVQRVGREGLWSPADVDRWATGAQRG